jgi:ADP-ribose pyrophosphatase
MRPDVCTIFAVTKEKKILLLEEEQPSEEKTFTFPSGVVEKGDTKESCAKRELNEETGYTSENVSYWFSKDAGARLECKYHIFLAKDCELQGKQTLDPGERIKVSLISFEELLEIIEEIKFKNYSLYPLLLKAKYSLEYRKELSRLLGITT